MGLWKENKFDPSATLFEDEEQLKICKNCGPLPLENFSDDGKYEKIKVSSSKIDPLSFKDKKRYKDKSFGCFVINFFWIIFS